ncbi:UTR2 [Symbiodinium necroappetens]|uniref:UTR2 protein n=1 Tax=Symbiodinium necroappetens TaxID=1628268 RepID=A0A812L756_9DINO|nr:UTR2 [Symbiodinium necroappetens]
MDLRLGLLVVGFFLCHVAFEALNEMLVTLPNVPHSVTLWSVAAQFGLCTVAPMTRAPRALFTKSSWWPFVTVSCMVFLSNGLSQYSTHHVEFTVKIVAKASKLLPTMLISGLLGNSSHFQALDYAAALLLCAGTALFSYGGGRAPNAASSWQVVVGMLALALSCIFDGLVPNLQQKIMRTGITSTELMIRTNAVGSLAGVAGIVLSRDVMSMVAYAGQQPELWWLIPSIGLSLAGSVLCYTDLVAHAGSVAAVGVATLRKSASLLLSYFLFPGKPFSTLSGLGLLVLTLGLLLAERRATSRSRAKGGNGNERNEKEHTALAGGGTLQPGRNSIYAADADTKMEKHRRSNVNSSGFHARGRYATDLIGGLLTRTLQANAVEAWVRRVVVAHGLCPWADGALRQGSLAVVSLFEDEEEQVAAALVSHAQLLALQQPPEGAGATTLLVAPRCEKLLDFEGYLELCDWVEEAFSELDLIGKVQMAAFHPDFRFNGSDAADCANFVGRAPYPAFHLLREEECIGLHVVVKSKLGLICFACAEFALAAKTVLPNQAPL